MPLLTLALAVAVAPVALATALMSIDSRLVLVSVTEALPPTYSAVSPVPIPMPPA